MLVARSVQRFPPSRETFEQLSWQAPDSLWIRIRVCQHSIDLIVGFADPATVVVSHQRLQQERRALASSTSSIPSALRIFCFARENIVSIAMTVRR